MRAASVPLLSSKTPKGEAPRFDGLAGIYRWMEYLCFGPALSRCRTDFLADLMRCRNALVIGDGDGRFTAKLIEANPAVNVDAIDASPAMLQTLLHRARKAAERVRTEVADARAWQPVNAVPYDLVVTHFFLDCLTTPEVRSLAERIRNASTPNALWVVSDFAVPGSFFGRTIARPVVSALYLAFGILTGLEIRSLPDHAQALAQTGFRLTRRRTRLCGLLVSELWTIG
jgi:SAM-dependent methyltransferase